MKTGIHALFVLGRISKGERRFIVLRPPAGAPFPGPWDLRAVFGS